MYSTFNVKIKLLVEWCYASPRVYVMLQKQIQNLINSEVLL